MTDALEGVETYATVNPNGDIFVSLIDSNSGDAAKPMSLKLQLPAGYTQLSQMTLAAPGSDMSATTGVTLGGAVIQPDGRWDGIWKNVAIDRRHLAATVVLGLASAMVLKLSHRGRCY